jgi:hypothetical protein
VGGTYQVAYLGFTNVADQARLYYRPQNGTAQTATAPVTFGTGLHHIVGTFENAASGMKVYIDGSNSGATNATPATPTSVDVHPASIGGMYRGSWSYPYPGAVATVRVYNRPLTAAEVLENYDAGILARAAVKHATVDVTLALESTSSVATTGAKSGGREVTLAVESVSSVVTAASQTQAIRDVTLALESVSAIAVAGSIVQNICDVTLAVESVSTAGISTGYWGNLDTTSTTTTLAFQDRKLGTEFTLSERTTITHLGLYLTNGGQGAGSAGVRLGVYTSASGVPGRLLGYTVDGSIPWDVTEGWYDYAMFAVPLTLDPGTYAISLHYGPSPSMYRYHRQTVSGNSWTDSADIFSGGMEDPAGTVSAATALYVLRATTQGAGAVHAAVEITLAAESVSTVAATGTVTEAIREVTLALESVSAIAAVGTKSGGVEITLALEATSSVAVAASQTQAVRDVTLAVESASSVTVTTSVTQATRDITLALESTSAVAAAGSVTQATREVTLALESVSSVAAVGSVTQAIRSVVLTAESTSTVTVAGSQTQAVREVTLALESTSAVIVAASQTQATRDVVLALESTSSVVAVGAKSGQRDVALALESVSSVTVAASQTQAVREVVLALESVSSIAAVGSKTGAAFTRDVTLAAESVSAVAVAAAQTQATRDVTLAVESTSVVRCATVSATDLLMEFIGSLAKNGTAPGNNVDPTSTWANLTGAGNGGLQSFGWTVDDGWAGAGTPDDPYGLVFNNALAGSQVNLPLLVEPATGFTLELWFDPIDFATDWHVGLVRHEAYLVRGWRFALAGGTARPQIWSTQSGGTGSAQASSGAVAGRLNHIVVSIHDGNAYFYLDGAAVGSGAFSWVQNTGTGEVNQLGFNCGGSQLGYPHGTIPTMRYYARGLTTAEIHENYAAGVLARTSVTHATVDVTLAAESTSAIAVATGITQATRDISLAAESTSAVAVTPLVTQATRDCTLALESVSAVSVAGSVTQAVRNVTLAVESTSGIVVTPTWVPLGVTINLPLESRSTVTIAPTHIGNDIVITLGAPESGWRTSIIDRTDGWHSSTPVGGWSAREPAASDWQAGAGESGWSAKRPKQEA